MKRFTEYFTWIIKYNLQQISKKMVDAIPVFGNLSVFNIFAEISVLHQLSVC